MRRVLVSVLCFCSCVSFAGADNLEGPTKGVFDEGVAAYDAGDYQRAYRIFSSIEDENLAAMRNIAYMRRRGQGTRRDPRGAEEMYERAARGGLPTAQADLGEMLLNGEAGKPNPAAAAAWLSLAASAHHPVAEFELGELYEEGSGVDQNLTRARELYRDAAARGVPGAKERLAELPAGYPFSERPEAPPNP